MLKYTLFAIFFLTYAIGASAARTYRVAVVEMADSSVVDVELLDMMETTFSADSMFIDGYDTSLAFAINDLKRWTFQSRTLPEPPSIDSPELPEQPDEPEQPEQPDEPEQPDNNTTASVASALTDHSGRITITDIYGNHRGHSLGQLPPGIYIISTGGKSFKTTIRR